MSRTGGLLSWAPRRDLAQSEASAKDQVQAVQCCQEEKVDDGEFQQIAFSLLPFRGIKLVGDETGHAGDQRTKSAQVHTDEKSTSLLREGREEHGRRHIAYDLRGKDGGKRYILIHDLCKGIMDRIDPSQIADEDEEEYKCKKEGIVHLQKCSSVRYQDDGRYNAKHDKIMQGAHHGKNADNEEGEVEA